MILNNFKTKKIDTQLLAEQLKQSRERKGLSLEEVSRITKIGKRYLIALENGNYDRLPADIFVKGFLRRYAPLLDLEAEEIIALYLKERNLTTRLKEQTLFKTPPYYIQKSSFVVTPKIIIYFFILLILGLFLTYFFYQVKILVASPELALSYPATDLVIKEKFITIEGKTDRTNSILINNQVVFADENGNFKKIIHLETGVNELVISVSNRLGKTTTVTRRVMVEEQSP